MEKKTPKRIPLFHKKQYEFVTNVLRDCLMNQPKVDERSIVIVGECFAREFFDDNSRFEWGTFMKAIHGGD